MVETYPQPKSSSPSVPRLTGDVSDKEGGTSNKWEFAALAYIAPMVGGIIAMLADGRNQLTRVHAQQSIAAVLTLVLSFFLWAALGYDIALIPGIGPIISIALFALVIAVALFLAVNWLISFLRALRGEERTIPLGNRVAIRVFGADAMPKKSA